MDEKQKQIFASATEHDGQYLLMRRFRRAGPRTERDAEYEACQALVTSGHAQWLTANCSLAPGIRLTGKPEQVG